MYNSYFIDENGNYFEALDPIETPIGAISVEQKPDQFHVWNGSEWTYDSSLETELHSALLLIERSKMRLSFAQLLIGLVTEQWISEAEGEAWLSGVLPFAVLTVIDNLPAEQRFAAKARALRPAEISRNDSLVNAMAIAAGKSDDDIDNFFRTYSGV